MQPQGKGANVPLPRGGLRNCHPPNTGCGSRPTGTAASALASWVGLGASTKRVRFPDRSMRGSDHKYRERTRQTRTLDNKLCTPANTSTLSQALRGPDPAQLSCLRVAATPPEVERRNAPLLEKVPLTAPRLQDAALESWTRLGSASLTRMHVSVHTAHAQSSSGTTPVVTPA